MQLIINARTNLRNNRKQWRMVNHKEASQRQFSHPQAHSANNKMEKKKKKLRILIRIHFFVQYFLGSESEFYYQTPFLTKDLRQSKIGFEK